MKKPKSAPRNPLVAAAKFRKAGAHGAGEKARRRAAKMDLQRDCGGRAGQYRRGGNSGSDPDFSKNDNKSISLRPAEAIPGGAAKRISDAKHGVRRSFLALG